VDPVLIRHALFNLIHNAVQAAPHGPVEVSLEAETFEGQPGWAIAVGDQGPGLSPEVQKHLLTPFFTTRKDGTGLGLPVADQIVAVHGGRLRPENQPGGGARFVIWLPATRDRDETQDLIG
jgi:signal transduction histidine kinase